jgi:hypothetical protein
LRSLLFPVIFCLATGSASADAPFVPPGVSPPDYVVTKVLNSHGQTRRQTVAHHGIWTRVHDGMTTEYFSGNGAPNIRILVEGLSLTFERGRVSPEYRDNEPRNTGERQTHLDESCTVWDVWRSKLERPGQELSHLSCITDDGIEVWQKTVSSKDDVNASAVTEHVERRPVAPDEVRPARTLLVLDWWNQNPPALGAQTIPDNETVMELSEDSAKGGKSIRTTRRLGPWQFLEETADGTRRSLRITHDSQRMWLMNHASGKPGVPESLTIVRAVPAPAESPTPTVQAISIQKDLDRAETVLGETCRWFDMMPSMTDGGRRTCLTKDGIVLKDEISGRVMGLRRWTAIRVTRRPITIDEIKPPAELLMPQTWGIE